MAGKVTVSHQRSAVSDTLPGVRGWGPGVRVASNLVACGKKDVAYFSARRGNVLCQRSAVLGRPSTGSGLKAECWKLTARNG
ncbi:MAG: hypothetical protein HYX92_05195 [Chloroflexi bacterium]|nr:hypothetical protein [Chloroflexota bacterium]